MLANEPHRFRFPNGKHMAAVVQHHNDGPVEIRPLDALFECFTKVFYLSKKQSADGVIDRATFSAAGPISRKIGSLSVSLPNEFPMKCSTQSSQQIKKQSAPNLFKPPHQGALSGWVAGGRYRRHLNTTIPVIVCVLSGTWDRNVVKML